MKKIRNIFSILLAVIMLVGLVPTNIFAGGGVAINDINFPDYNFQSVIKAFDKNNDYVLSEEEIDAVQIINTWGTFAENLQGIEYFTNLTHLTCSGNNLGKLDVSMFPKLIDLSCSNCGL